MKKKSLIDNLKATKKANIATQPGKNEGTSTRKSLHMRTARATGQKYMKIA